MIAGLLWRVAPYAALAVAGVVIWGLWGRLEAANTKLAAANAVIAQRELDGRENARVVAQLAQKLNDTETKVITQVERIYAAPVTRECAQSPAMRAASDGVRAILLGDQAGDRAQPPGAMPGPDPGAAGRQR